MSRDRRWWQRRWMIFWVAFAVRVLVILVGHTYRIRTDQANFNFGFEAGRIARSVATGHGYGNPFNGVSGPTAWLTPVYPLLLAAAFKIFGVYTQGAGLAILVVNSLFSALVVPAVWEIGWRCFDARGVARRGARYAAPVAVWSAWVWAVYPAALQYAIHWVWEMSVTVGLFSWAIVVALRLRGVGSASDSEVPTHDDEAVMNGAPKGVRGGVHGVSGAPTHDDEAVMNGAPKGARGGVHEVSGAPTHDDEAVMNGAPRPRRELGIKQRGLGLSAWLGVLWGLIALSNASLLLCLPAMMVWVAWPELRRWRLGARTVVGAVLTTVMFAAVLAPWVVRNERVLHALVLTRDNFGVELYESTLERNDGFPWGTTVPLWTGDKEYREFVRMGEVKFAAMRGAEAKARIAARPWRTARWTVDRFLFFWDGTPHPANGKPMQEYLRQLSYSFISVCGLLGLVLVLRRRAEGAGLFAMIFLLAPLPYYLVTVQPRFRHPLEPLIAVLAVVLFRSTEKKEAMDYRNGAGG